MTNNNKPTKNIAPTSKYCPMLKQECIGEVCAWSRKAKIRDIDVLSCAIKNIAEKLDNMSQNINIRKH